ncbi:DUF3396 domain-containing protein [Mesorhizobium sp. B292B1B]|uniref:type VI immunity family protein n=1 Tax=unclassified Mesorhizobium TaxID=325217 RepID=UPI001128BA14|nr:MULTISPECIES: type VI immunity family protein [unclassified Mesorhizobium]MCA0012060.1 DUF3396 domain-containing protein [Mesorhizobium sp. B294B1A1]MCA0038314.1 DUF3396 domain-containing protein [Mesorhizobium sp. B292B1B]TPM41156.1 DUF3396 domain-containing protein [Mesorhizobium sp. B2-3-2]
MYKLAELADWRRTDQPETTASVKVALAGGRWLPYLEPARKRIREGRGFELRLWDGRGIEDPAGSYSLSLYGVHFRDRGVMSCARFLFPVGFDVERMIEASRDIAARVRFKSGHGGLTFAYNPTYKAVAFEEIYYRARRFWCIDVEDLEATLAARSRGLKTVSWITMLGSALDLHPELSQRLKEYSLKSRLELTDHPNGSVAVIGTEPVVGDVNRPGNIPDEYFQASRILEPALIQDHPDFYTDFFSDPNTMKWIRRFVDPAGWR